MFCKRCGKEIPNNSNVCQHCGSQVTPRKPANTYTNFNNSTMNNSYRAQPAPQKKQKKTPWKIIAPIVAVLLIVAIVFGIFACTNSKKKEVEDKLRQILEESTTKPVVEFMCEDYDGDGRYEAYAVVGDSEEKEEYVEYYDADICFVNETEAEVIKESVRGHANGTIEVGNTIYVSLEVYDDGVETGKSFIYTAEDSESVESDISGQYANVHEEDGKILGTDEDGNEIEVELTDRNEEENEDNEETTEEETTVPYDALSVYKESLNNGQLDSYIKDEYEFTHAGETECILVDINDDGIDELYVSVVDKGVLPGVRGYPTADVLFAIQDGKVVNLAEATSGGGSMGGDTLGVTSNPSTGKPFIYQLAVGRDGIFLNTSQYEIYSYDGKTFKTGTKLETWYYEDNPYTYGDKVAEIKSETDLYVTESDGIRCYMLDGKYISEQEYDKLFEDYGLNYERTSDRSQFDIIKGTYSNPLS